MFPLATRTGIVMESDVAISCASHNVTGNGCGQKLLVEEKSNMSYMEKLTKMINDWGGGWEGGKGGLNRKGLAYL